MKAADAASGCWAPLRPAPFAWIGLVIVVQNFISSLLNSHLFDFHEGWVYVMGVGIAGGMVARAQRLSGAVQAWNKPA